MERRVFLRGVRRVLLKTTVGRIRRPLYTCGRGSQEPGGVTKKGVDQARNPASARSSIHEGFPGPKDGPKDKHAVFRISHVWTGIIRNQRAEKRHCRQAPCSSTGLGWDDPLSSIKKIPHLARVVYQLAQTPQATPTEYASIGRRRRWVLRRCDLKSAQAPWADAYPKNPASDDQQPVSAAKKRALTIDLD